ncbi:MAG: M48 family metalloprotease [Verrucomicrobia bacterium]|nr:M48 family metalloprotease [Verrucomicrobiota bacterium]
MRSKKRRLFYFFALNMLGTVLAFYVVIAFFFLDGIRYIEKHGEYRNLSLEVDLWHPKGFLVVFFVIIFVILAVSWSRILQLKDGGSIVAIDLGARPLMPFTQDLNERKLLNVVEEMALASGVEVPEIYILDGNHSINAFAAGFTREDSVIGVTQGALKYLSRDELQGVIAHEFSHILNEDVKIRTYLAGLSFGFMFLIKIFGIPLRILRNMICPRESDYPTPSIRINIVSFFYIVILLFSLGLVLLGFISYIFGLLLQLSVSRQMERLADGTAAQYTRYPEGLASALKKIGAYAAQRPYNLTMGIVDREYAPLFFADTGMFFIERLLSSHPPLLERIRTLDPSFDGNFLAIKVKRAQESRETIRKSTDRDVRRITIEQSPLWDQQTWAQSGFESPEVQNLLGDMPIAVLSKLREPLMTAALILALELDAHEAAREKQREIIRRAFPEEVLEQSELLSYEFMDLNFSQKYAIGSLSLPSLRQMSREQFLEFDQVLEQLIEADEAVDLFEYCLLRRIRLVLSRYFGAEVKQLKNHKPEDFPEECGVVLSIMARMNVGSEEEEMREAFELGVGLLRFPDGKISLLSEEECKKARLEKVFGKLRLLERKHKGNFLLACRGVADFTGKRVEPGEEDYLRLLGYAMEADREMMAEHSWCG